MLIFTCNLFCHLNSWEEDQFPPFFWFLLLICRLVHSTHLYCARNQLLSLFFPRPLKMSTVLSSKSQILIHGNIWILKRLRWLSQVLKWQYLSTLTNCCTTIKNLRENRLKTAALEEEESFKWGDAITIATMMSSPILQETKKLVIESNAFWIFDLTYL